MKKHICVPGKKYGRLTVIKEGGYIRKGCRTWVMRCQCGKVKNISVVSIVSGKTKSCGCIHSNRMQREKTTHGLSRSKIYEVYSNMITRCYVKKNKCFYRYGGRGITVCEAWKNDVTAFYKWGVSSGYTEGLQLDRIDNKGNYTPDNCRWVTRKENMRNTSRKSKYIVGCPTRTIVEFAEQYDIPVRKIYRLLKQGKTWDYIKSKEFTDGRIKHMGTARTVAVDAAKPTAYSL